MKFFPFEKVREEQNKLIEDIREAIYNKKNIIAHAPTGLGKTAAALTPALKLAEEKNLNIFFLTSRNSQHKFVIENLQKINKKEKTNVVDFVGKKHMCPKLLQYDPKNINFFEFCMDLKKSKKCNLFNKSINNGHASKKALKFSESMLKKGPMTVDKLIELTQDNFCTYEISLLMGQKARVVVADYFHIFDLETQRILFSKLNKKLSKTIIVVDEAHNLPDRIRNDWTLKLNKFILKDVSEQLKDMKKKHLRELVNSLKNELETFSSYKLENKKEINISKDEVIDLIEKSFGTDYSAFLDELYGLRDELEKRENTDAFLKLFLFLKYWKKDNEGFVRIIRKDKTSSGKNFASIEYCCLDPSIVSRAIFKDAYCSILMSGTLLPGEMYRDILGLDPKNTKIKTYENPFPQKNKLVIASEDITTKYEFRTEEMFKKIAVSCAYVANAIKGNSALFFSSYSLMSQTMKYLEPLIQKETFVEKRGMSKREREELINNFKKSVISGGGVLVGVQGASFSEGVDLPGEYLKGVAIIGIPLAPPDLKNKALIEYYNELYNKGWDYGYVFPAINRALQAAGRCIRSEEDKGIIAFLDKRFLWSKYQKIIPPDWNMKVSDDFRKEINEFLTNS